MSFFNRFAIKAMLLDICVSILVLVDVFLQLIYIDGVASDTGGFNPCFSGCLSSTVDFGRIQGSRLNVSILVLVDVFLQQSWSGKVGVGLTVFQSLF